MKYRNAEGPETPAVLVLRALGLGDLLAGIPALRAVRRGFPSHRIVLATTPVLVPLVEELEEVDFVLDTDDRAPLDVQLESEDVAVNLHGRGPESTYRLLDVGADRLIAFFHPDIPATYGSSEWRRSENERARWCRLLTDHGVSSADPTDFVLRQPPGPLHPEHKGAVVIHPGAGAPARRWPVQRWSRVAEALAARGETVLITGSRHEARLAGVIAHAAGLPLEWVLAGSTDPLDLTAVIANARMVVCADTGPAHLATALRTPSVVLFGPSSPAHWGPPPSPIHLVLWKGRRGDPLADRTDPGLLEISVGEVLSAVARLLYD
jgi:ADP-heptose:LPS heptosyltransferase